MGSGYYTSAEAASITDVPRTTIDYWVRTGLVEPSISLVRPRLFSFLDLRDLCVIDYLRGQTSTRKIRQAVAWLREVADVQHVVHATCYVTDGGDILWVPDDAPDTRVSTTDGGQLLFRLSDVWRRLGAEVSDGEVVSLRPHAYVEIAPDVRGGTPVVSGTRIPTSLVVDLLNSGMSADEVSAMYPRLKPEAIHAVAEWEKQRSSAA